MRSRVGASGGQRLSLTVAVVSAGVGPAFGVVFEEDGFDEFADEVLFVGVEVAGGFEGEGEVVVGAAFVGFEEEAVGGDVE